MSISKRHGDNFVELHVVVKSIVYCVDNNYDSGAYQILQVLNMKLSSTRLHALVCPQSATGAIARPRGER